LALLTAPSVAQSTPSQVIDTLSNQVLAVLRDKSLETDVRRTKIEDIIYRYVDFETLSRLVMARNWNRLSDPQKSEFMTEFKKHLSHTYGDNIDNYRNERVAILSERPEKRGDVTVKSKIVRGGSDDILVDYRLRKREENWRIIDVVIEGVSLVANFRSQFQEIMTSGGAERLLKLLREKNLEPPSA
jgi:phospholipid transport system substrate-binding protein